MGGWVPYLIVVHSILVGEEEERAFCFVPQDLDGLLGKGSLEEGTILSVLLR